jgi:uncharacterized protein YjbI with pentapeptide repeats
LQDGDKTFEFTHKSFGEYLTACRIIRMVKKIDDMFKRHDRDPDDGWDERQALAYWAEVCGATPIDNYLYEFIKNEIARYEMDNIKIWQQNFVHLIESAAKHGMPMEKLNLETFQQMLQQSRNAEEALLTIHCACAEQTKTIVKIDWGTDAACSEWLKRIQGPRVGAKLFYQCLAYLDLSGSRLLLMDFVCTNLQGADLRKSNLLFANFWNADLQGADLQGADLKRANLQDADLQDADLQDADLQGADLKNANIENANLRGAKGANLKGTRGTPKRKNKD